MKYYLLLLAVPFLMSCKGSGGAASPTLTAGMTDAGSKNLLVGYYNVENLFDTKDNPDKIDEDFTPEGRYVWTEDKYERKLAQLARAIKSIGGDGPDLLGLGEVENASVIEDLCEQADIKSRKYKYVHFESPDMRGIDVAFLYDSRRFKVEDKEAYEIYFEQEPEYTSRKVLRVSGKVNKQSFHILVNHWPSRRGGQEESEFRRIAVAKKVRSVVDEIYADDKDAHVIIMGDLNDDPHNRSIVEILGAVGDKAELKEDGLFNPMKNLHNPDDYGSLTYRGKWNLFDQIIMSEDLMDDTGDWKYEMGSAAVHNVKLLQVGYGKGTLYPRRGIFRGEFVPEGFSDHFPVYVRLLKN